MDKGEIPKTLPTCDLLQILFEKTKDRHDTDFNFFGELDRFYQHICGEVSQINVLFPDYTPHDDKYHLNRLFFIADKLIKKQRFIGMNSAELLILSIAIYGHDWGMAVSDHEKQYILDGKCSKDVKLNDFFCLPNEKFLFTKFANENRLCPDETGSYKNIPLSLWQEYVRQTHYLRSAERVKCFFKKINGSVADAASRVCKGHWIEFEELQDMDKYPVNYSVLNEPVNLRALAVYLRLIDLFDLTEERTPYVIWKYVAPRDSHSQLEWKKHRAIYSITFPAYQEGRIIQVDGSTDNNEVYAALEDLKDYCKEQLRGCNDILATMNDSRHTLDFYDIEWRIATSGFEKTSIRFEFDRKRMFDILGDEIYQGDRYVFLRELLQNSIDAIRMRREILKRHGSNLESGGLITVNVKHFENGDAEITWCDDGIGMDEYIIKNYLAIAGKSYYTSEDFKREGLKLDPISRFGVGILSCFMVADRIEIITFKDPYLTSPSDPIKIVIPDPCRQFRIEILPKEISKIGTTIKVYIDGKKLINTSDMKQIESLEVTKYLSIIAGFVEFPIVINEDNRKTIILHPKQNSDSVRKHFGKEFDIYQLNLKYPWSDVIFPQDMNLIEEFTREEKIDIFSDLNLEGYDGVINYFVPKNDFIDFFEEYRSSDECIGIKIRGQKKQIKRQFRWNKNWGRYLGKELNGIKQSRSSLHSVIYSVYRDGILLATASPPKERHYDSLEPEFWYIEHKSIPAKQIIVNIPKIKAKNIDLARTQILNEKEHWSTNIFHEQLCYVYKNSISKLLKLDPFERWYQLGHLIAYNQLELEKVWEIFPQDNWPILFLSSGGNCIIREWQDVRKDDIIYNSPDFFYHMLNKLIEDKWITKKNYTGPLKYWNGDKCLITNFSTDFLSLRKAQDFWRYPIEKNYLYSEIKFVKAPWDGNPPLMQRILHRKNIGEEKQNVESILEKAIMDPTMLNPYEKLVISKEIKYPNRFLDTIDFPKPFEKCIGYGGSIWNNKHPLVQALIKLQAKIELSKRLKTISIDHLGLMEDFFQNIKKYEIVSPKELNKTLLQIWAFTKKINFFDPGEVDKIITTYEDFILPDNINAKTYLDYDMDDYINIRFKKLKITRPFGIVYG